MTSDLPKNSYGKMQPHARLASSKVLREKIRNILFSFRDPVLERGTLFGESLTTILPSKWINPFKNCSVNQPSGLQGSKLTGKEKSCIVQVETSKKYHERLDEVLLSVDDAVNVQK